MTVVVSSRSALAAALARMVWPWLVAWLVAWWVPITAAAVVLAMLAAVFVGAALHEAGHALAYWGLPAAGRRSEPIEVRSRLILPLGVAAPGPPPHAVLAAGPLLPAVIGAGLLAANAVLPVPAVLVGTGWVLAMQVLGLLPGCDDGDRLMVLSLRRR